ncbi:MAG: tRNA lysidine(34) synthetase TilS [Sphingomonas adhaesiva]|uniref:tRNA lysidine(34) synthetase TilS n=1 Tax=Sphingomonas adhaesiva TaxID=28212 RepID=UPI002FFB745B
MTPPPDAAVERFRATFRRLRPTDREAPVVVAVSGGADSLALLLLVHGEIGAGCLAATVDHGLRPEAAQEAAYVAGLCAGRGISHVTLRDALPDRAGATANVSARARALRYRLLETYRARAGAAWIATAHHADDQVETLVMRLNRGAGVGGLAGIRETNGCVIRPLLEWRRDTLAGIVAAAGWEAVEDPSNSDERYDRARLRASLGGVDWLDREQVAFSAHNLAAADEALDWAADDLFARQCRGDAAGVSYVWRAAPRELQWRLVARCVRAVAPESAPGKAALVRTALALLRGERVTVADVLCSVRRMPQEDGGIAALWRFERAPPRRSH